MYYEVFTKEIRTQLEAALGADYKVTLNKVIKNNDHELTAVSIHSDASNVAPNIYLENFFSKFEEGDLSYADIVEEILNIYYSHMKPSMDISFFTEFDQVKDHIIFKLINKETNANFLVDTPYSDACGDLCTIYQVLLPQTLEEDGSATITIKSSHLALWNKELSDIHTIAMENTPRLLPAKLQSMANIMLDMFADQIINSDSSLSREDAIEIASSMMPPTGEMPMWVLSNESRINGGGCILYPNVLKSFADEQECNLFILFSSVHETIITLDNGSDSMSMDGLSTIVAEVNSSSVAEEDILGTHCYYYNRETNEITY